MPALFFAPLFDPQRIRLPSTHDGGKLLHRITWLWYPDLRTRIVELRRDWPLRLISEDRTRMAVASGVVPMQAARVSGAHWGKTEHDDRRCRVQNLRHGEISFSLVVDALVI